MLSIGFQPVVRRTRLRIVPLRWNANYWCPLIRIKAVNGATPACPGGCAYPVPPVNGDLQSVACAAAAGPRKRKLCPVLRRRTLRRTVSPRPALAVAGARKRRRTRVGSPRARRNSTSRP
jgi:hypothetical protein